MKTRIITTTWNILTASLIVSIMGNTSTLPYKLKVWLVLNQFKKIQNKINSTNKIQTCLESSIVACGKA